MLYTKSIFAPIYKADGRRISVMSRHTLDDGITPDVRITPDSYHEWLKILAPPAKLVGDYYNRGLSFEDFARIYRQYLSRPEIVPEVEHLSTRAMQSDITLLCVETSPERCHRRILAEECKRYHLNLKVKHK